MSSIGSSKTLQLSIGAFATGAISLGTYAYGRFSTVEQQARDASNTTIELSRKYDQHDAILTGHEKRLIEQEVLRRKDDENTSASDARHATEMAEVRASLRRIEDAILNRGRP